MILFCLAFLPMLLWDDGPQTAPALEKAGIREIATTRDAAAWASTRIRARSVDAATLIKLSPPGVDYQIGRASATAAPWVKSNLWRLLKDKGKTFVYEVTGNAVPLAMAEAQAAGTAAYFRVKPEDLAAYQKSASFARELEAGPMPSRANFGLVDDGTPVMEEVMNLLARRNLLFEPIRGPADFNGPVVRVGTKDYTPEIAANPYMFASVVRGNIGDDHRLVRVYGSETTLARLYGDEQHARLHLIQYGRNAVPSLRVRVLGHYRRILITSLGSRVTVPEDIVTDKTGTEFSIPDFKTYAVVDLDAREPGVLNSAFTEKDFELTADPSAPQWKSAPMVKAPVDVFGATLPMPATEIRSRWTRDAIYLLYTCPYRSLSLKPSPDTSHETAQLWNWDVAEAFLGADEKNIHQYREYQVSPQSEWVDLDIDVLRPKPGGGMPWNSGFTVKGRIDEAHKVWYGEMRIPLASISSTPLHAGDHLRLGLFRLTGVPAEHTLIAWQPSFRHNFHVPEAFGTLVLAGPRIN